MFLPEAFASSNVGETKKSLEVLGLLELELVEESCDVPGVKFLISTRNFTLCSFKKQSTTI